KKYINDYKEDITNVEEVETRLEFPLEKSTIAGRVDVIIGSQDKSLEVRDYKTSEEVTSEAEAALQVQLYTLGLKLTKHNVTKASISYFKDFGGGSQIVPVDIADKDLSKAKETAKTAISGIRNNVWTAKIGEHCKGCDFKKICKYTNVPRGLIVNIKV
ncbi:PD-(D/E)XK nuclease family protein, partial [Candidatus Woesearchaeota archaeon]|nr:PD-(D/E)XK nuclease family protein [Candidatus Woesearchaeota archaeon]